jgi:thioredoxin 1
MAEAAAGQNIRVISNGGQEVNLQSLLPEGKITVVDFSADWCGPCRAEGPDLKRLVKEDPNFALVKIDIVKWGTPVAKQFNLPSIPNMRLFDHKKQQVGASTSDFTEVMNRMIEIRDGRKPITATAVRVSPASTS